MSSFPPPDDDRGVLLEVQDVENRAQPGDLEELHAPRFSEGGVARLASRAPKVVADGRREAGEDAVARLYRRAARLPAVIGRTPRAAPACDWAHA